MSANAILNPNLNDIINKRLDDLHIPPENNDDLIWLREYTRLACTLLKNWAASDFKFVVRTHTYTISVFYVDTVKFNWKALRVFEERNSDIFDNLVICRENGMLQLDVVISMTLGEKIVDVVKTKSETFLFEIPRTLGFSDYETRNHNQRNELRKIKEPDSQHLESGKLIEAYRPTDTHLYMNHEKNNNCVDPEDWIRVENFAWFASLCAEGFFMQKLRVTAEDSRYILKLWFNASAYFSWKSISHLAVLAVAHFDDFVIDYDSVEKMMRLEIRVFKGNVPLFATKGQISGVIVRLQAKLNRAFFNVVIPQKQ